MTTYPGGYPDRCTASFANIVDTLARFQLLVHTSMGYYLHLILLSPYSQSVISYFRVLFVCLCFARDLHALCTELYHVKQFLKAAFTWSISLQHAPTTLYNHDNVYGALETPGLKDMAPSVCPDVATLT